MITAAHCVEQFTDPGKLSQLRVRVGMHYLNENPSYYQTLSAEKTLTDNRYDNANSVDQVGDIGFIKLRGSIVFSRNAQPACLSQASEHFDERVGSLQSVGWGSVRRLLRNINDGSKSRAVLSNTLKSALFNYVYPQGDDEHLIKTEPVRSGESICVGDTGGK